MISLAGVLLAAFVPTFLKHLRTSKIAEATERLASLHAHAAAYYALQREPTGPCLPPSAGPYPSTPSPEPRLVDFTADETGAESWRALGLSTPEPLRYSYELDVPQPGCRERVVGLPAITFRAHGDLDGDGEPSLLERSAAPNAERLLVPHGPLRIVARTE